MTARDSTKSPSSLSPSASPTSTSESPLDDEMHRRRCRRGLLSPNQSPPVQQPDGRLHGALREAGFAGDGLQAGAKTSRAGLAPDVEVDDECGRRAVALDETARDVQRYSSHWYSVQRYSSGGQRPSAVRTAGGGCPPHHCEYMSMIRSIALRHTRQKPASSRVNMMQSVCGR